MNGAAGFFPSSYVGEYGDSEALDLPQVCQHRQHTVCYMCIRMLTPNIQARTCFLSVSEGQQLGISLSENTPVLVDVVVPDSLAARAGVCSGDIVLEVNGKPVSSKTKQDVTVRHAYICTFTCLTCVCLH